MEVIILRGVPASGKSTWARAFVKQNRDFVIVSRDGIREMIGDYSHSPQTEGVVTKLYEKMVKELLAMKKSLILDNCHAQPKYISETLKLIESTRLAVKVTLKEFEYDVETCVECDAKRERTVGREVIEKMDRAIRQNPFKHVEKLVNDWKASVRSSLDSFRQWNDPIQNFKEGLPLAVIFDVDGTLAHMKSNGRSPFDWKRVGEDFVDPVVRWMTERFQNEAKILIVSGRDSVCKKETEEWLLENEILYDAIFMRPENDMRKDSLVKEEIYNKYIKDNFNVILVVDDRKQVVDQWRSMGLKVAQMEPGEF